MGLFLTEWATILIGFAVHAAVDRAPNRRTRGRLVELALLWLLVLGGFWVVFGGLFHIGPTSNQIADEIGFTQSMFQWEVGWADISLGVLGMACAWPRNRDGWMTAAVVGLLIAFWGDGIGHVMSLVAHHNTAPDNVWSMPTDFLQPLLAVLLLRLYRANQKASARPADATSQLTSSPARVSRTW